MSKQARQVAVPKKIEPTQAHSSVFDSEIPDDGNVWLVGIDANGNEIPNTLFSISPKGYERFYSDETKFLVKKKVN